MHYPKGDDDNVLRLGLRHKGFLNAGFKVANFFEDKEIPNGLMLMGDLSKEFEINEKNKLVLGANFDYAKNFYLDNGFTNLTPEVIFSHSGKKLNFSTYVKQQFGFIEKPKMLPAAKNQFHTGMTFSKRF